MFTWTVNIWKLCYLQFLKPATHFGLLPDTSYREEGEEVPRDLTRGLYSSCV